MEAINVLESKPKGIKLFDSVVGECVIFDRVEDNHIICSYNGNTQSYKGNGKIFDNKDAIVVLNPSRNMRDWSKFAWKKGDVLATDINTYCIFDSWENDTYTQFRAKYICRSSDCHFYSDEVKPTCNWTRVEENDIIEYYINIIERSKGGKLNLSTLEIEKHNSQFKDGDIVAIVSLKKYVCVAIYQMHQEQYIGFHAVLCNNGELLLEEPFREDDGDIEIRPATDSEKQQLFSALEKDGKAWDAEKKQIVDLPKKCEFKPMDWCLMRMHRCIWRLCQYSTKSDEWSCPYIAVGGNAYEECIPYTDQTAHLLGTTDDWKGDNNV